MASKFIALFSTLTALANTGVVSPVQYRTALANPAIDSVASTYQNVVRSFDGTISKHSKIIDTRINNSFYSPAIKKTLTYASAPIAKTITYVSAPAPAPVVEKKTITYTAPVIGRANSYPAPVVQKPRFFSYDATAPVTKTYLTSVHPSNNLYSSSSSASSTSAVSKTVASPSAELSKPISMYTSTPVETTYNHGSSATTYAHQAPGVSGYGSSQTVRYSPAEMVSHMRFDGFGTQWGY